MKTVQISLNSIGKVKSFVNAITQFDFDFDLISGRYVIDAKSIMGIFSLDLSKPIELAIHTETGLDEIMEVLKPYIIELSSMFKRPVLYRSFFLLLEFLSVFLFSINHNDFCCLNSSLHKFIYRVF